MALDLARGPDADGIREGAEAMNRINAIGPMPLERLLLYLRLAIEEARMTRSVVESRLVLNGREPDEVTRAKLADLDSEIAWLESRVVDMSVRLENRAAA